jgi:hypothetical protein
MNRKIIFAVIAAAAIGAGAWGYAADSEAQMGSKAQQGTGEKPGMQGMQGMHEMMGMMRECQGMMGGRGMMGGGMSGGGMMPQLPPGNEKLQLQMWAEMMQKMGEIAGKYAGQVK